MNTWREFLMCWRENSRGQEPYYRPQLQSIAPFSSDELQHVERKIAQKEALLGVRLPRSYVDFCYVHRPRVSPGAGFYDVGTIGSVRELDPELASLYDSPSHWASDDAYFLYGFGQDGAAIREVYVGDLLIVGYWADSLSNVIAMNPRIVTVDGEMETWLFGIGHVARTVSFAEAMRQLSCLDTLAPAGEPLYAQSVLKGTCADHIAPRDVWWK